MYRSSVSFGLVRDYSMDPARTTMIEGKSTM